MIKTTLKWIAGILVSLIVLVIAMFVGTGGEYSVASLVTDYPILPSETVEGVQLHLHIAQQRYIFARSERSRSLSFQTMASQQISGPAPS